jgi:HEPN domain-containing protein
MDKQTELQQWIEIADKDFALAEYASKNMWPVPVEQICFHCQQTAEKYLKWFLVWHDIDPPKIHNLVELGKLCEKITPEFAGLYTQYVYLNTYGVQQRYPSEMRIEKQDMDRALEYAKMVREFVRTRCPEQFRDAAANNEGSQ